MAEIAARAFVAKGTRIKDMKNDGMFAAVETSCTLCIRGSARSANMVIPSTKDVIAFVHAHLDLSTPSSSTHLSHGFCVNAF